MHLTQIPAYVYFIRHKTLGYYYWGSRTANIKTKRMPEEDLWNFYFTSSKTVRRIILEYGLDCWEAKVIYYSTDIKDVYWYEQDRIKEHIEDPMCLNKKYQDRESNNTMFSTSGKPAWNKGIENPAIRGENNPACKNEVGDKISASLRGRSKTKEHKKNLSLAKSGVNKGKTYEEIYGEDKGRSLRESRAMTSSLRVITDEHRKNYSNGQKGKRWITDGTVAKPLYPGQPIPEGFKYGRLPCSEESKKKNRESQLRNRQSK